MIKLLAVDVDGTFLNSEIKVDPRTKEAVKFAKDNGVEVALATGRSFDIIPKEIFDLPEIEYLITSNGAITYKKNTREEIFVMLIPNREAVKILEELEPLDPFVEAYSKGTSYISKKDYDRLEEFVGEEYLPLFNNDILVLEDDKFERCEMFVW